ncbi:hypothetical protein SAMN05216480_101841 [Pustulibacterium marinum]|uniref:Cof subfamily of IIB subfamily of haloacid dehalogenase superfamily/HAD-superfamily hydrolase, subfamily IIB n=1 Tax=Pustulibacterium marinum TaxID=1224947 RepID=A0A1I7FC56_9FLAO|nr:HAD family hydrolase [Pustulibacterium marinum]SFU33752.1 hypothetical protein SAMN05216480_101841 [Pustulibacterium marinum]
MTKPNIVFTDIDGTLLNADRDLSEATLSIVEKIKKDIPFVLVSARMPKQMKHIQEKLGVGYEPLIAYNGALVLVDNKPVHSVEVPLETAEYLMEYNESNPKGQFHISLYHHDEWYAPQNDFWAKREENNTKVTPEFLSNKEAIAKFKSEGKGLHKINCMGDADLIEEAFAHFKEKFENDLHLYRAKDTYIEIAPKEVSKLTGIKKVFEFKYPQFITEDVIAFGDNYNDAEMIGNVGWGIAVENARDEVKAVAKDITAHHKEDGVAKYLTKVFS